MENPQPIRRHPENGLRASYAIPSFVLEAPKPENQRHLCLQTKGLRARKGFHRRPTKTPTEVPTKMPVSNLRIFVLYDLLKAHYAD